MEADLTCSYMFISEFRLIPERTVKILLETCKIAGYYISYIYVR